MRPAHSVKAIAARITPPSRRTVALGAVALALAIPGASGCGSRYADDREPPVPTVLARGIDSTSGVLTFTPDGRTLGAVTTPGVDARIGLWSRPDGRYRRFQVPNQICCAPTVAFSLDGGSMVVGSTFGSSRERVPLFDVMTGERRGQAMTVPDGFDALGFTFATWSGSAVLIAGIVAEGLPTVPEDWPEDKDLPASDGAIVAWDVTSGQQLASVRRSAAGYPELAAGEPGDGERLVSLWHNHKRNEVLAWSRLSRSPLLVFKPRAAEPSKTRPVEPIARSMDVSDDGRLLVVGVDGQPIHLWDLDRRRRVDGPREPAVSGQVALTPDGRFLAFHGPEDRLITVWDVDKRQTLTRLETVGPREHLGRLAWSRRYELAAIVEGRLLVWDFHDWK